MKTPGLSPKHLHWHSHLASPLLLLNSSLTVSLHVGVFSSRFKTVAMSSRPVQLMFASVPPTLPVMQVYS